MVDAAWVGDISLGSLYFPTFKRMGMYMASEELKNGRAGDVGMAAEQLERAGGLLQAEIDRGSMSAASLLVTRRNTVVLARGFGHRRPEPGASAVDPDSVFLLASITKPVTACAAMLLVDRGQLSLGDKVSHYIPEYCGWERQKVLVQYLLSHTSGMPDMLPQNIALRRAHAPLSSFVEGAIHTALRYEPNTNFAYQSKGILLAAEIVERLSGKRLRDFEEEEIFAPLGMRKSSLGLGRFAIEDTVWCGTSMDIGEEGRHWGANSPYWRDIGCPWGGMHSTGPDLAILLQAMLNGGEYGGKRVFSRAATAAMTRNQNWHLPAPWGLGWALRDSQVWNFFGELVSEGTFGHVGATGTVAWADPERELICVVLTNQMVEGGRLLRRVSNAVAAAVVE